MRVRRTVAGALRSAARQKRIPTHGDRFCRKFHVALRPDAARERCAQASESRRRLDADHQAGALECPGGSEEYFCQRRVCEPNSFVQGPGPGYGGVQSLRVRSAKNRPALGRKCCRRHSSLLRRCRNGMLCFYAQRRATGVPRRVPGLWRRGQPGRRPDHRLRQESGGIERPEGLVRRFHPERAVPRGGEKDHGL